MQDFLFSAIVKIFHLQYVSAVKEAICNFARPPPPISPPYNSQVKYNAGAGQQLVDESCQYIRDPLKIKSRINCG